MALVSMPWGELNFPSLQLGLLKPLLEREGFRTEVFSFYLALMDYFRAATADLPDPDSILISDYRAVTSRYWTVGMGDWIFAVPPFREPSAVADEAYLAYLRREGVPEAAIARALQMRRLAPGFLDQCLEELLAVTPGVVGFTSTFNQNVASLTLARMVKQRDPSVRVVFGGANCDGPMGAALHRAFPWVDVVVRGEAEAVLPGLMRDLLAGTPVTPRPGLCFWRGEQSVVMPPAERPVVLDEVPVPDYDEYFERLRRSPVAGVVAPRVKVLFESGRGCWWGEKSHCTFCGLNGSTMRFRSKSPERVLDEVFALAGRYRRLEFEAVDNILDHRYFRALLPRLRDARQSGFDFTFFYETKANLKKEHIRLLRDAGVVAIQPGLESLSTPILRRMRKGVTALQNIRLLKWAAQYGLEVTWNLLYGFPGEPPEEYPQMARLMPALSHLKPPSLVALRVQRFSPYHESPRPFGLELAGPAPYYPLIYPLDAASLKDLAYEFAHAHADGRDPETYVAPVREAVAAWDAAYHAGGRNALRSFRGPGFLKVSDRRPGLGPQSYLFGDTEAQIYLACDAGATPPAVWRSLPPETAAVVTVAEIREFLDQLVAAGLVYAEGEHYLSLALPGGLEDPP